AQSIGLKIQDGGGNVFDDTHYVPILKALQGEYSALETLTSACQAALTPLLEIPPMRRNPETEEYETTLDAHLEPIAKRIEKARGTRSTFVDLGYLPPRMRLANGEHPVERLFADARALGLKLIPVTGLWEEHHQEAVARVAAKDGRGMCIRVEQEPLFDGSFAAEVLQLVQELGVTPADVDLVLDLGRLSEGQMVILQSAIPGALASLPALTSWRSLTLAGGAFPETLSDIRQFGTVPRLEWRLWNALRNRKSTLARIPTFGDYAVHSAGISGSEPVFFSGAANIRYTCTDEWAIFRGRQLNRYGYDQFYELSESLQQQVFFSGPSFSWGDQYIADCARQVSGPGNNSVWRKVGTSHHLTFVVRQLSSASGPSTGSGPRHAGP
ncbi:MAG TPA: beta family protein, partial [Archangium sp.]|nr:beta family protein [Archangium sp.]